MHDCHTHSLYSGDVDKTRGSSIDGMAAAAVAAGLDSLAVTDHLEIHQLCGMIFPPLDNDGIARDIAAAKEKYAGKLNIIYGVELAQMMHDPRKTETILSKYHYEFIIGSSHSVRGYPDFSDMDYDIASDSTLRIMWERYLSELDEILDWGRFDVLAHITYPTRYFTKAGRGHIIDIDRRGREYFEGILKKVIEKGIALEINTSGLRQNLGVTLPNRDLAEFYYQLGGREISVGSDAHYAYDLGKGIRDAYEMCRDIGFKYVTVVENGEKTHRSLEKELS